MTAVLALTIAAMAAAMVVMGIRLSGALRERDKAVHNQTKADESSIEMAEELKRYKNHKEAQLKDLREDIETLENDLENCATPGSRRQRLRDLLSKAQADAPDHH